MDFFHRNNIQKKKAYIVQRTHSRHIPSGAFISHSKYNHVCSDKLWLKVHCNFEHAMNMLGFLF